MNAMTKLKITNRGAEVTVKPHGNNLRRLRVHMGLTVEQMAELCYVSPLTIGRWERGDTHPLRNNWRRICEVTSVINKVTPKFTYRR